jgi:type II secretory pathway pseudopilin PulG
MDKQNISRLNEPVQSSKHIWIVIIVVVLTAIIVGSGVYVWQKSSLQSTEQSLKQQITDLQNQIINLQELTQPSVVGPEVKEESTTKKPIVYVDKINGYQLTLPSSWVDYKVFRNEFALPTKLESWSSSGYTPNGYGTVFYIRIHSLDEYATMKKVCDASWGPGCYTDDGILGKTDESVFTAYWPNSGPNVSGDEEWGKLAREVNREYLKNNFSIIK